MIKSYIKPSDEVKLKLAIERGYITTYIDRYGKQVYVLTKEGAIQWMKETMQRQTFHGYY